MVSQIAENARSLHGGSLRPDVPVFVNRIRGDSDERAERSSFIITCAVRLVHVRTSTSWILSLESELFVGVGRLLLTAEQQAALMISWSTSVAWECLSEVESSVSAGSFRS